MNGIIYIYSDGACRGNPGPGGWGALLKYENNKKEINGAKALTTNNAMELTAVIESLKTIKTTSFKIIITTDSQYVKNGITKWIIDWKIKNWKTSNKKLVKNRKLWEQLDLLTNNFNIEWRLVKGHTGHFGNERADELANIAIDTLLNHSNQIK